MKYRVLISGLTMMVVALWFFWAKMACGCGSQNEATRVLNRIVAESIARFHSDVGRYPTADEGLDVLFRAPGSESERKWKGPYIAGEKLPGDPWLRLYVYEIPGTRSGKAYDFYSLGPDGIRSADDVGNW